MKMKLLIIVTLILPLALYCSEGDSLIIKKSNSAKISSEEGLLLQSFHFPELDKKFPLKSNINSISSPEFTFDNIAKEFPQMPESIVDARSQAERGFKEIDSTGKWISSFSNEDIQVLPVGVKHKINEVEYQLGFMKASFTKDYTELLVFAKLILPQTDEEGLPVELFFGASNIKLSHQGGIIDGGDLVLLGDIFIPFGGGTSLLLLKGGFDYDTADVENRTYVTIDCDGFKEMQLQGEVQFSRNVVLPLKEGGELDEREKIKYTGALKNPIQIPNRVRGEFKAVGSDWGDMIVEIGLTPFVIKGQEELFTFEVNNAVFDFSTLRTEGVSFPSIYQENGWLHGDERTWQGVYISSLEIGLPKPFKSKAKKGGERVSFEAENMILDSHGVSGSFSVNNIIRIDKGITSETNGWAYSVEKMTIDLAANNLVGAGFEGQIVLPISDELASQMQNQEENVEGEEGQEEENKPGLRYKGLISEEEFMMSVETGKTIEFDVFKAKAQLQDNSAIELNVVDGSFRPKAILNGRMAISANQKKSLENEGKDVVDAEGNNVLDDENNKKTVEFKGITFERLVLQTESPLISVDRFGYEDTVELAGFPVSIRDIDFSVNDTKMQLDFNLKVNLMSKEDKGFSADARLEIKGKNDASEGKQKWKYDGLAVSEMILDVNIGVVEFYGELFLRENDSVYGKGFAGTIDASFGPLKGIESKAVFGKKDFRYWYVDAAVEGFKIPVGPMTITGVAGGAYYKMTRKPGNVEVFSPSGLSYEPNKKTRLGVKTMVFGEVGSDRVVNFGAGYEIEFSSSGGVRRMGLYGEAQFFEKLEFKNPAAQLRNKLAELADTDLMNQIADSNGGKVWLDKAKEDYKSEIVEGKGHVTAYLGMDFDFVNDTFHAQLNVFVDTPGGFLTGVGDKGRAGWGEMFVGKDDWFIYIGIPDNRVGLKLGVGPAFVKFDGYFMTGTKILGSPPPPADVADIMGVDATTLDYMRDENALGTGRGFAFGADLSFDTKEVRFLMLYARLRAGVGFDLMMKNYGDARCVNTGDEVGIHGWYTNGQAYAYMEGEIGIKIKLFFKKKKVSIFKGGAAVLMQAKLPNPFWMRGYMTGKYSILNGWISGRFRLRVTLGKECEFENEGPLNGIKMIADVTPEDNDTGVDVFAAPQATFSLKVNQPIIIPEDSGDNTYKVVLEKFKVTNEAEEEIKGTLEWASGNSRVTFIPEDILPPATKLKAVVSVSFQEKVGGVFKTILEDGQKALETEERNFTTGTAPDHIPLQNIQYAYPVVNQQYFYTDEYKTGYIKLKQGQDYLFDNAQWQSVVKYIGKNFEEQEAAPTYNAAENKLYYQIPDIAKSSSYKMTLASFTKASEQTADAETEIAEQDYGEENVVRIKKNTAQDVVKEGTIERLAYNFSTSNYKTFAAKVKNIDTQENNWGIIGNASEVMYLSSKVKSDEGFDLAELQGSAYTEDQALILAESDLKDAYFTTDIDPIIYQKYALGTKYSTSRNTTLLGFRPKRALPIFSNYITSLENRTNLSFVATQFPYRYNLPKTYHADYMDIRTRVINDFVSALIAPDAPELSIIETTFKLMSYGKYTIKLHYNLPGGIPGTSANYQFKNPMKF